MKKSVLLALLGAALAAPGAQANSPPRHVCHGFSYRGVKVRDLVVRGVSCVKAAGLTRRYYYYASPAKRNGFQVLGPWKGYPGAVGGPIIRWGARRLIKVHGPAYRPLPPAPTPTPTPTPSPAPAPKPPVAPWCHIVVDPPVSKPDVDGSIVYWRGQLQNCTRSMYVAIHFWLTDLRIRPDQPDAMGRWLSGYWTYPVRVDLETGGYQGQELNPIFGSEAVCFDEYHGGRPLTNDATSGYVEAYEYTADPYHPTWPESATVGAFPPGPESYWLGQAVGTATSAAVPVTC